MIRSKGLPTLGVLVPLVAVLAAAGCGGDNRTSSGGGAGVVPSRVTVGSDIPYPPFEFGKPPYRGFDVDIVNEVAKRIKTKATFRKTTFDTIFRELAQGKFSMVASSAPITPERERTVDFSIPYFPADQSLMVKRGSDVKTVDDLDGRAVGAQLGAPGAEYAKDKTKAKSVRTYDLIDDAFNALAAGQVDAVINDFPISKYAERSHKNLVVVQTLSTGEHYGIAFQKGSALKSKVDDALNEIKRDGTYTRIYRKWFREDPPKSFVGSSGSASTGTRY
jgi:ABC-type amino acid transport substrate-binding protein